MTLTLALSLPLTARFSLQKKREELQMGDSGSKCRLRFTARTNWIPVKRLTVKMLYSAYAQTVALNFASKVQHLLVTLALIGSKEDEGIQ